jgi:cytochrome c-type biogenesis protein CcmE
MWTLPCLGTRLFVMSRLDDDLARAVREAGRAAPVRPGPARPDGDSSGDSPPADEAGASRRRLGLLLVLLVVAAGVVGLVLTSLDEAVVYTKGVDELLVERERFIERNVRVEGTLVQGTLRRRAEPCEYRFSMQKRAAKLSVRYPRCVVPETLRDVPGTEVRVTVEGRLTGEGHLEADRIMTKCPSKYDMQQRQRSGEDAPHLEAGSGRLPQRDPEAARRLTN